MLKIFFIVLYFFACSPKQDQKFKINTPLEWDNEQPICFIWEFPSWEKTYQSVHADFGPYTRECLIEKEEC